MPQSEREASKTSSQPVVQSASHAWSSAPPSASASSISSVLPPPPSSLSCLASPAVASIPSPSSSSASVCGDEDQVASSKHEDKSHNSDDDDHDDDDDDSDIYDIYNESSSDGSDEVVNHNARDESRDGLWWHSPEERDSPAPAALSRSAAHSLLNAQTILNGRLSRAVRDAELRSAVVALRLKYSVALKQVLLAQKQLKIANLDKTKTHSENTLLKAQVTHVGAQNTQLREQNRLLLASLTKQKELFACERMLLKGQSRVNLAENATLRKLVAALDQERTQRRVVEGD